MLITTDEILELSVFANKSELTSQYVLGGAHYTEDQIPDRVEYGGCHWELQSKDVHDSVIHLKYLRGSKLETLSDPAESVAQAKPVSNPAQGMTEQDRIDSLVLRQPDQDLESATLDPLQKLEQLMTGNNPGSHKWHVVFEFNVKRGHAPGRNDSDIYMGVVPYESLVKKYHMKTYRKKMKFHSASTIDALIESAIEYITACDEVMRTMDCVKKLSDSKA